MAYSLEDFSESLERLTDKHPFQASDVCECLFAWGETGYYSEWSGGFLVRLKNGKYAIITGWCDTTGWGCRDGIEAEIVDSTPADIAKYLQEHREA